MAWPKEEPYDRYPSDLTDEEWEVIKPILEQAESLYDRPAAKSRSSGGGQCYFLPE